MPINELLPTEFDEEIKKTRTMLERVPEDKPHVAQLAGFGLNNEFLFSQRLVFRFLSKPIPGRSFSPGVPYTEAMETEMARLVSNILIPGCTNRFQHGRIDDPFPEWVD